MFFAQFTVYHHNAFSVLKYFRRKIFKSTPGYIQCSCKYDENFCNLHFGRNVSLSTLNFVGSFHKNRRGNITCLYDRNSSFDTYDLYLRKLDLRWLAILVSNTVWLFVFRVISNKLRWRVFSRALLKNKTVNYFYWLVYFCFRHRQYNTTVVSILCVIYGNTRNAKKSKARNFGQPHFCFCQSLKFINFQKVKNRWQILNGKKNRRIFQFIKLNRKKKLSKSNKFRVHNIVQWSIITPCR